MASDEGSGIVGTAAPSSEVNSTITWEWENAGGKFGLSGDWREAISIPTDRSEGRNAVVVDAGASLRGDGCMAKAKQAEVWDVLAKRRTNTPSDPKVGVAYTTKYSTVTPFTP